MHGQIGNGHHTDCGPSIRSIQPRQKQQIEHMQAAQTHIGCGNYWEICWFTVIIYY